MCCRLGLVWTDYATAVGTLDISDKLLKKESLKAAFMRERERERERETEKHNHSTFTLKVAW